MIKVLLAIAALACAVISTNSHKVPQKELQVLEGDMLVTNEQANEVLNSKEDLDGPQEQAQTKRFSKKNPLWEGGTVPYVIDRNLDKIKGLILSAVEEFHNASCVRWVERKDETDWVRFVNGTRCASSIGKSDGGGEQLIILGVPCYRKGIIMHEMLHTLGFWHEQSRLDRNKYVKVLWKNIAKGAKHNFKKYPHTFFDVLNFAYDTKSLMHYPNFAFSKGGKPTLVARKNPKKRLGQLKGLTALDTAQLNCLYCPSAVGDGSQCNNSMARFRSRFRSRFQSRFWSRFPKRGRRYTPLTH